MTTVTAGIAVSLDGFAAGPNQSTDLPFGEGVDGRLHVAPDRQVIPKLGSCRPSGCA